MRFDHLLRLTPEELDRLQTIYNWVLIRPRDLNESKEIAPGAKIYIETTYEAEFHSAIVGTVVKVPSILAKKPKSPDRMEWDTEIEVEVGDEVTYHFLSFQNAVGKEYGMNRAFTVDGQLYIFVHYQKIYVARRGDEVIPLNGFILAEPIEIESEDVKGLRAANLEVPKMMVSNIDKRRAKVVYTGSKNKKYFHNKRSVDSDCEPGDVVMLEKDCDVLLETKLHSKMFGGKQFFKIQRRHILALE